MTVTVVSGYYDIPVTASLCMNDPMAKMSSRSISYDYKTHLSSSELECIETELIL